MNFQKLLVLVLACAITAMPTTIYTSTDVPKGISGTSLSSTITVPDSFLLTDVNVAVNLAAFESSDHVISVTSPGGTSVQLFNQNCSGGFDIIMTFDDEAGSDLGACTSLNGDSGLAFQPVGLLSSFDGQQANGIWTLNVSLTSTFDSEDTSLRAWSLALDGEAENPIPEPATFSAAALGLLGLAAYGYRRRRRGEN
jgi:MYXO-CTERM domain-containing protein